MNEVARALTPSNLLLWVWWLVVWVSVSYLVVIGALVFMRPTVVHRFIDRFVNSQRIDFLEMALRFTVSVAFVAVSPETKLPRLFFCFGATLAITAIPMMCLHRFQRRQAEWAIPFAKRILPLMGISALALGGLIAWAIT